MTTTTDLPLAWVVPGPLRQVTGGYLYDARIVDGLRERGWRVGVVDVRSTCWHLDPGAGQRLASALGRERWSAVVVDELAHPAIASALMTGRLRHALAGAPLILLVHHLRCSEPGGRFARGVALLVEWLTLKAADLVICTSETTARTVRSVAGDRARVEVVQPGWDTHESPRPGRLSAGEGASLPSPAHAVGTSAQPMFAPRSGGGPMVGMMGGVGGGGHLRLLLVGHWTPRKGILDALAAIARLGPDVTLDLVGEQDRGSAYAARVRSALADPDVVGKVRVHGRVSAEALAALFAAADALVLPSTHEGYGMVLAEALAAGLPIVATRVGAVPEVVRDGQEAVLVPPGDISALASAIDRLARDPAERERRAGLARERADSLPRWSDSIAAFDGHLRALLARRASDA